MPPEIHIAVERYNKSRQSWQFVPPPHLRWYYGGYNDCLASLLGLSSPLWFAPPPIHLRDPFAFTSIPADASAQLVSYANAHRRISTRCLTASWLSGTNWEAVRRCAEHAGKAAVDDWKKFRKSFLGDTWGSIRRLQNPDHVRLLTWITGGTSDQ